MVRINAKRVVAFLATCFLVFVSLPVSVVLARSLSSEAPAIFDVRRSLPLEPGEPVYHDYYISAGPEAGFKEGMLVKAVRQIPVHDPVQNKQQALLTVDVGRLQIIHVQRGLTVARLHSQIGGDKRPTLEYETIMVGDRIERVASETSGGGPRAASKP